MGNDETNSYGVYLRGSLNNFLDNYYSDNKWNCWTITIWYGFMLWIIHTSRKKLLKISMYLAENLILFMQFNLSSGQYNSLSNLSMRNLYGGGDAIIINGVISSSSNNHITIRLMYQIHQSEYLALLTMHIAILSKYLCKKYCGTVISDDDNTFVNSILENIDGSAVWLCLVRCNN
jgi:hypothetical protein